MSPLGVLMVALAVAGLLALRATNRASRNVAGPTGMAELAELLGKGARFVGRRWYLLPLGVMAILAANYATSSTSRSTPTATVAPNRSSPVESAALGAAIAKAEKEAERQKELLAAAEVEAAKEAKAENEKVARDYCALLNAVPSLAGSTTTTTTCTGLVHP